MYRINEFLTPSERMDAMRVGGMRKLAAEGMTPMSFTAMVKESQEVKNVIDLLSTALRTSVFIGAPLGAVWYAMKSGLNEDSKKTRRMKETLDHYNDVVAENNDRLGSIGLKGV